VLERVIGRGRISREVLGLLMSLPGQELHTREIARRVAADAHPVQRALEQLLNAGLVQSRRLGNLRLWSVAEDSPLVPALRDVMRQATGIAASLRSALRDMRGLHLAFIFGSYASGRDEPGSDIDVFVVGKVDWPQLSAALNKASQQVGREVNPVVWNLDELAQPRPSQKRFIADVLSKPRIWLVGDDRELERSRGSLGAPVGRVPTGQARPARRRRRPLASSAGRNKPRAGKT